VARGDAYWSPLTLEQVAALLRGEDTDDLTPAARGVPPCESDPPGVDLAHYGARARVTSTLVMDERIPEDEVHVYQAGVLLAVFRVVPVVPE
jgi:hypothetical protein